jgi:hypothetical protein
MPEIPSEGYDHTSLSLLLLYFHPLRLRLSQSELKEGLKVLY